MNMLGLIFADEHDASISELTKTRTYAAIPFGSRYRLVDFFISNMTNSGVRNIGVVATTKYESLMAHLRSGAEWDLHRRHTGLSVLPPFSYYTADMRYDNVLQALQANVAYLKVNSEDYVLFTIANAIGNIDYDAMLQQHIKSGARFTCLCTKQPYLKEEGTVTTQYKVDKEGRITDITISNHVDEDAYIAANAYIMKREDLLDILTESIDASKNSLRRDVLMPALKTSKVMAYVTDASLMYIENLPAYLKANLALLDKDLRNELFGQELRPIITRAGNSAPAYYGEDSEATNSMIAAGTVIEGTVRNSIIFRGVHIKKGAVVENCVINQDVTIGEGAHLNYAVLDKRAYINDKRMLSGYITHPFFVEKETII